MEQEKLLRKIGNIFQKLGIPYIITGGIAVAVWGRPRFTADIDIVIELIPQKLDKLAEEFKKIGKNVYFDKTAMMKALKYESEFNLIHSDSGLKIDFWILKNEPFDKERMKRKVAKNFASQKIFFTSPEDLILIKLRWYKKTESTRQLEDIESILKIQKKLDWAYLKKWAEIHSTIKILESLKKKIL